MSDLVCPFCNENDFDKIGLKYHLKYHCEEFDKTPKAWEKAVLEEPTPSEKDEQ